MDNSIQNIAQSQRLEIESLTTRSLIKRTKIDEVRAALSTPLIKVISGPRRAGKSTLALQALHGHRFAYLNLEDERLPSDIDGDALISTLDRVYGKVDYYFFDEIQNLSQWEKFLNRLHRLGKNVIVTGSNARLLNLEFASALTGRYAAVELLPLSLKEIASHEALSPSVLAAYLKEGGFPEVVMKTAVGTNYLSALWDAIVLKDIVQRHKIRQVPALRNLLTLALTSIGSRYSTDSLTRSLKGEVSAPTTKKFLSFASEAYLIFELSLFHSKPRRRLKSDRKAYTVDNGFFSSKQAGVFDDLGKLLENLVFVELMRRGLKPNFDLFYYETKQKQEVDFLVRDGVENRELVQASYSLSQQKTRDREYRALAQAAKELDVSELTLVTMNERRDERCDGRTIRVVPLKEWCLER